MSDSLHQRGFVVVPSSAIVAAREIADALNPGQGPKSFACPLVPTGSPEGTTPTAFVASAEFLKTTWAALPAMLAATIPGGYMASYDLIENPNAPWIYLTSVGLSRPATTLP